MDDRRQPPFRMIQLRQQIAQPIQTEIDQPRMQAVQARDDAFDARGHAATGTSLTRSSEITRASVAFSSVRFTTMSTMPCSCRYSAR